MKFIIPFIITILFIVNSYAQEHSRGAGGGGFGEKIGTIKGKILDSTSNIPVPFASIAIMRVKDSSIVGGCITDDKGGFLVEQLTAGMYNATITSIGYKKRKIKMILIKPGSSDVNLGVIKILDETTNLNEVNIVAEKKTIEYSVEKKTVNVEKSITSTGGTAVDVLQTVPSVTVDQDNNVSIRGNGNITILIDGRPAIGMTLDQIPATSIESIEVITNPSAKYNPEGTSGIINIIMKKHTQKGLNGMISANTATAKDFSGFDKYNASGSLNYKGDKFNVFGSYDTRRNVREGGGYNLRDYTAADSLLVNGKYIKVDPKNSLRQDVDTKIVMLSNNFKIGTDLLFNDKNTLTLSYMHSDFTKDDKDYNTYTNLNGNSLITKSYKSFVDEVPHTYNNDYALNYKRTYDQKGKELTLDGLFSQSSSVESHTFDPTITTYLGDSLPKKFINTLTNNYKSGMLQGNYILPIKEDTKLETGFQADFREREMSNQFDTANNVEDLTKHQYMKFQEQYYGIYATYSTAIKNYKMSLGARLEGAFNQIDTSSSYHKTKEYYNIYPNILITRKLSNEQELQLVYTGRINRPKLQMISPFFDYDNPELKRVGNIDIKPEYINSLEAGYRKIMNKTTIYTAVFGKYTDNVINRILIVDPNTSKTTIMFENQSYALSYGLELVWEQEIFKWWRVSLNGSYFQTKVQGVGQTNGVTSNNYSYTAKFLSNWFFGKGLSAQLISNYTGPIQQIQTVMQPMYYTDMAIKKDLFGGKANIALRVSDIFNTLHFQIINSPTSTITYAEIYRKRDTRTGYISFTYKFGSNQTKVKAKKTENAPEMEME